MPSLKASLFAATIARATVGAEANNLAAMIEKSMQQLYFTRGPGQDCKDSDVIMDFAECEYAATMLELTFEKRAIPDNPGIYQDRGETIHAHWTGKGCWRNGKNQIAVSTAERTTNNAGYLHVCKGQSPPLEACDYHDPDCWSKRKFDNFFNVILNETGKSLFATQRLNSETVDDVDKRALQKSIWPWSISNEWKQSYDNFVACLQDNDNSFVACTSMAVSNEWMQSYDDLIAIAAPSNEWKQSYWSSSADYFGLRRLRHDSAQNRKLGMYWGAVYGLPFVMYGLFTTGTPGIGLKPSPNLYKIWADTWSGYRGGWHGDDVHTGDVDWF